MNKNLLNLYLVASLMTLIPGITTANSPNPIPAFSNVISQSMHQLSILANNGPNTQTFQALAALLTNLFGSMQSLSEPYWNKQINDLVNQNDAILQQIQSLENQLEANTALNINTLSSVNVAYSSQYMNIQTIGQEYMNAIIVVANPLNTQLGAQVAILNGFQAQIDSLTNPTDALASNLASISANVPTDQASIIALKNFIPNQALKLSLSSLTPTQASFYCNQYSVNFNTPFMNAPDVIGTIVATDSPVLGGFNDMDLVVSQVTPAGVTFQVCDQDLGVSGAGFTLINSNVNLLVFSKDQ